MKSVEVCMVLIHFHGCLYFMETLFYISPKEKHFKNKKERKITRTFSPSANIIVANETTRG